MFESNSMCLTGVLALVVAVIAGTYLLFPKTKQGGKKASTIPGPDPTDPTAGNLSDLLKAGSLHEYLTDLHATYGPITGFWWGSKFTVSTASPQLLKQQSKVFDRPYELFSILEPLIGSRNIQLTNGAEGKLRHAAYSKCFTGDAMKNYIELFQNLSKEFVAKWGNIPKDQHIPLRQACFDFSIRAILRGSMGGYFTNDDNVDRIRKAYNVVWVQMELRSRATSGMTESQQEEFDAHAKIIYDLLKECIEHRKLNPPVGSEYLAVDAIMELDMSDSVTLSDMLMVFIAGFHTTGLFLTWALVYLASHQDVQQKLFEELMMVAGNNHSIDADNIMELQYMQQLLDETLRCAVVGPYAARISDVDMELGGHLVPAGTPIVHALGVILQDPSLYPEPDKFDPDRFSPENIKARPSFAFAPFGCGKRKCLGYRFALVEAKILLAEIIKNFVVSFAYEQVVESVYGFVTHPKEEVWVSFKARV